MRPKFTATIIAPFGHELTIRFPREPGPDGITSVSGKILDLIVAGVKLPAKPVSRQRVESMWKKSKGLCVTCGKPRGELLEKCRVCQTKHNERQAAKRRRAGVLPWTTERRRECLRKANEVRWARQKARI